MSELSRWIAGLTPEVRAKMEARLMDKRGGAAEGKIPRRAGTEPCPLSFAQQRLWFLNQLDPDSPIHNIARALRIRGPLDLAALQRALDALVARHEALRTTFAFHDGSPVQVVAPPRPLDIARVNLRPLPDAAARESELPRLLQAEATRPFDLTRDLMLRALVAQLGPEDFAFLLVTHHIASDGWSLGLLYQELAALYSAFAQDRPAPLPELPIQYADYALWQRQLLQGPTLAAQLAYWTRQLADAPALLELPTDHPRPPVQSYRGARHAFEIPQDLTAALLALSRREGTTLFMTLLAAFHTLLHRLSGHTDIVVGSPIAGRTRLELESLIGVFVNTLPLRAALDGTLPFRQFLAQVRQLTLDAYDRQDLPFERLVEELRPARSLAHAPLFQVMFVLQNTAPTPFDLPGLPTSPVELEAEASEFDLTFAARQTVRGLSGYVQYSTDLFEAETIARWCGHFRTLLEGIVADPTRPLAALPLLSDAERHQLLVEWNATQTDVPRDACLPQLLDDPLARSPEAVAVICDDAALTYRDLHRRANQLAHHLRARGVGPDTRVGLCVERSLDLLVGVLGILKAGGAYVPLDPAYPPDRLAFMLADAQAPVLVTQAALREILPKHEAQTIYLDADWPAIAAEPDHAPATPVTADHLAYVIYTSGSTGQPKGVQIPHRALVNFLDSMRREPGLTPQDCLLAVTTLSFDIAGLELFLPLLVGAKIVLATRHAAADGAQLLDLLHRHAVTVMQATPATWHLLLEAGWTGSPSLTVLCGGEALSAELATALCARSPRVFNLYGPTETTIWSTLHRVAPAAEPVPFGRPIANTEIYLLDSALQPVPLGVPGELHIGGLGLARGYLDRPDLTAAKFIPHPFRAEPPARLYKTGDLARYRSDGSLLYLGRLDQQVKLRGFRIELGEIEAALEGHPAVRQAVVLLREDRPGDRRLVAYLVAQDSAPLAPAALRDFLKDRLPLYMLPAAFVPLDAFPLTPSGKVDRKALRAPLAELAAPAPLVDPPASPLEQLIADIWRDLLGLPHVGAYDNFFDLGGHSLLAMQVIARLEKATGVRQRPNVLFTQTLRQVAAAYERGQSAPRQVAVRSPGIVKRILGAFGRRAGRGS
jgi:amino acid adenylation domain-containing protein